MRVCICARVYVCVRVRERACVCVYIHESGCEVKIAFIIAQKEIM